jgi:hypothetical protein
VSVRPTVVSSHGLPRASARNARTQPMRRTDGTTTDCAGRHVGEATATDGR